MKGFLDAFFDSISSIFRIFDLSYFIAGSAEMLMILFFYGEQLANNAIVKYVIEKEILLAVILIFCSYLLGIVLMGLGMGLRKFVRHRKYKKQKQDKIDQHIYNCIKSLLLITPLSERAGFKFNMDLIDLDNEDVMPLHAVPTPYFMYYQKCKAEIMNRQDLNRERSIINRLLTLRSIMEGAIGLACTFWLFLLINSIPEGTSLNPWVLISTLLITVLFIWALVYGISRLIESEIRQVLAAAYAFSGKDKPAETH